jgi:hypothetical protein
MERYLIGLYKDDEVLLNAVKAIKDKGIAIDNVFTPFPVHGLDEALELRGSRLHTVAFIAGATGTVLALVFMNWTAAINYPYTVGGKPEAAVPAFIPITFEVTVLFAAVAMTLAFLKRNNLFPGARKRIFDRRITDDHFAITFELTDDMTEQEKDHITLTLKDTGAIEVREKDFEEEGDALDED